MPLDVPENVDKVLIYTGNILNLNEVKKKVGQKQTDELVESLKIVLDEADRKELKNSCLEVHSKEGVYTGERLEPKELTISVKLFVPAHATSQLAHAIDTLLPYLETTCIDSVVVAHPGGDLVQLLEIWRKLEVLVSETKVQRIGLSDVDTDLFISLYDHAQVKPSIVQINLASCCVVPPQLQEFAKQHDVQLLTHNDPQELLPATALKEVLGNATLDSRHTEVTWTIRFQVHVKCRGVLATKGYIVCLGLEHQHP